MRKLIIGTTAIALLVAPIVLHAGTGGGKVTYLTFQGGIFMFTVTDWRTGVPSCATQSMFALNGTTPAGRSMVAGILTAYTTGKAIYVSGTGACNDWGDTANVDYFYI